jgi:thymidine kinase
MVLLQQFTIGHQKTDDMIVRIDGTETGFLVELVPVRGGIEHVVSITDSMRKMHRVCCKCSGPPLSSSLKLKNPARE